MVSASPYEGFKENDAASYDPLTEQFDYFSTLLTSALARRLVELARISPDDRVLDVGTGTGIVALEAAKVIGRGRGEVVGVDLSEGMLSAARRNVERLGLAKWVSTMRMDAEKLDLPDASFDKVVSLFALLHFPNPERALAEMRRVLRPEGTLVLGIGSRPPILSVDGIRHYIRRTPDLLNHLRGRQLSGPRFLNSLVEEMCPPSPAPEESETAGVGLNRTRRILSLVAGAGFTHLEWAWEGHEFEVPTIDQFWELQRTFSSIARKRIGAAPTSVRVALEREFRERCETVLSRGGRLIYPYGAFFVISKRGAL